MIQSLKIKTTLVAGIFFAVSSYQLSAHPVPVQEGAAVSETALVRSQGQDQPVGTFVKSSEWKKKPSGAAIQGATAAVLGLATPGIDPAVVTAIAGNVYGIIHTEGAMRFALIGTLFYQLSTNEHTSQFVNNMVSKVTPEPVYAFWNKGVDFFKFLYPVHEAFVTLMSTQEEDADVIQVAQTNVLTNQAMMEERREVLL